MATTIERRSAAPVVDVPDTFNIADYLVDRHVREGRGGRRAILCGDESVTYAEVAQRSNQVANGLRELGVRREERVLLLLLDTPAFAYAFFGALKLGAVPIPTNTLLKSQDYRYMLNDSRARLAMVSQALLPQLATIPRHELPHLEHIIVDGVASNGMGGLEQLMATSATCEVAQTSKDDAAFWLYSSGTTGFPKGAVHLQHDILYTVVCYAQGVLGITAADRTFSVAKLFFAYGLGNALTFPFAVGATTILWPGPPTAPNVFAQIERFKPTLFYSVPTNYGQLLAHKHDGADFDLSSVRQAVSAGEALPGALYERFKERFGVEILDGIGSTEILHIFISNRPGRVRPGSAGELVPGYEARIVDEDGADVPDGTVGNLLIKGDSICAYYWNKHQRSKDTIEGHWIRTGDKFSRDADGYYWYAGRGDDMLKVGGIWVSPVEIENTLAEHPAVQEAGVIGRRDADGLEKPMAYVVLAAEYVASPELARELQDFVRSRIAEYKRPRWVEFVEALPKTATGKTQRFKLREGAGS
ncbi:MAG TPA: benzoate-CoA ligase family protein [Candidatus Dormibacteraeota bacterium]|nr:benzoate-CoA ligase family protein [Candidatus Dormibacteraeota bacterium]